MPPVSVISDGTAGGPSAGSYLAMAGIRWRGRTERRWATVIYTDPELGKLQVALHTSDPEVAELERLRYEREVERRDPKVSRAAPRKLLDAWLEDLEKAGRHPRHVSRYRGILTALINAQPRGSLIVTWSGKVIGRWIRAHAGWSPRSMALAKHAVLMFLRDCRGQVTVPDSLLLAIEKEPMPTNRKQHRRVFSALEEARIHAAVRGTKWETPFLLARYAGLSIGDLRTLRKAEIDVAAGSLRRVSGRQKTGERLWVPLDLVIVEHLKALKRRGALVCETASDTTYREAFARIMKEAKVDVGRGDGWHTFRRTFLTRLGDRGVAPHLLGALAGHGPGSKQPLEYTNPEFDEMVRAIGRSS